MSYDFMFFRPAGEGPMSTWPSRPPPPLGTLDEVKAWLAQAFPTVVWRALQASAGGAFGSWQAGDDRGEIWIIRDPEGAISSVTLSHCHRAAAERLARLLGPGIVALDPQKMTAYSIGDGAWVRTG